MAAQSRVVVVVGHAEKVDCIKPTLVQQGLVSAMSALLLLGDGHHGELDYTSTGQHLHAILY